MSRQHHRRRDTRPRGVRFTFALAQTEADLDAAFTRTHDELLANHGKNRAGRVGWIVYGPGPVTVPGASHLPIETAGTLTDGWDRLIELEEASGVPDVDAAFRGARLWSLIHDPAYLVLASLPVTRR